MGQEKIEPLTADAPVRIGLAPPLSPRDGHSQTLPGPRALRQLLLLQASAKALATVDRDAN